MSTIDPNHSHLTITPTRPNEDTALGLRSNFAPSAFRIIPFSRLLVGFSLLLACLFTAAPVAAQVAGYNFDSNIEDQVGDNGATYLIANMNGTESEGDPGDVTYLSDGGRDVAYITGSEGFRLPVGASALAFGGDFMEVQTTIKVADFPGDATRKVLFSVNRELGPSDAQLHLNINKVDDTTAKLAVEYRPGRDGGSGGGNRSLGDIPMGEYVTVNFQVDFANGEMITRTPYFYSLLQFEDTFDVPIWKGNLQGAAMYIGWTRGLDIDYHTFNTGEIAIERFEIFDEPVSSTQEEFEAALVALTGHVNETAVLSDADLAENTSTAMGYAGAYIDSRTIIDAYLAAFEDAYPPFYDYSEGYYNSNGIFEDYDQPAWVALKLQLDILDNHFQEPYLDDVEGIAFEHHLAFPGPVAESAVRVADASVPINATFLADPGANCRTDIDYGNHARRPTGYYAAPGEIVTLTFPAEVLDQGLRVLVGAHTQNLANKVSTSVRRFPRVFKYFDVNATSVRVANPFGGALYIRIPEGADFGSINVGISGAVKSPYYSQSSFKQTDYEEFKEEVARADVQWADIESDSFMYTTPLRWASGETQEWKGFFGQPIPEVLDDYENMWAAFQLFAGRPYPMAKAEYAHVDRNLYFNTLAGGYPMPFAFSTAPIINLPWLHESSNLLLLDYEILLRDSVHPKSTYWHELGHHLCLPTLPNEQETVVVLPFVVAYYLGLGRTFEWAFTYTEEYNITSRDDAVIDWFIRPGFLANENMTKSELDYSNRGISKYTDIAFIFGWDMLGAVNKVFHDQWAAIPGGQIANGNGGSGAWVTRDEYIQATSDALGVNAAPLFHFWGTLPSEELAASLANYPPSRKILDRLLYIRDLVPDNQSEFQVWFDKLANPGDNKDYDDYERVRDDYDTDDYHGQFTGQIDFVIDTYFPQLYFDIDASADTGGSISDPGTTNVYLGDSQTYLITAETGYFISDVIVDDESVGATESYTFENVVAEHTIHVTFELLDTDSDGVADLNDNCPNDANADQNDIDGDSIGDACDDLNSLLAAAAESSGFCALGGHSNPTVPALALLGLALALMRRRRARP